MDMEFGQSVPEPFGGDFLGMAENEIDQLRPDPLGSMLESVEDSIEQPMPLAGTPAIQPDTMLDMVERSTERQEIPASLPESLQDNHLWKTMDALETAIEKQVTEGKKPIEESPVQETTEVYGSFSRGLIPHLRDDRFIRERPYPERRMTGGRTGVRFGGGSMTYCQLRDSWVTPGECDSCDAFEPGDDNDGGNEHCRYMF